MVKRISTPDAYAGRSAWLWAWLGGMGSMAAASCLVPDADYCAFGYGDRSCSGDRAFCLLARHKASHEGIDDGCSAEIPRGFVHVKYGLPTMVAAPTERPDDPRALEAVLDRFGYGGCGWPEELEVSLGSAVAGVGEVRRHLEEHGRVRRGAMALSEDHVEALALLDAAVDAWVEECERAGTRTAGSSTSTGDTGTDSSGTTDFVRYATTVDGNIDDAGANDSWRLASTTG